jgi:hypothetical protein
LRIIFNKFNEVKALSAVANLLSYVDYFFLGGEGLGERVKIPTSDRDIADLEPSVLPSSAD